MGAGDRAGCWSCSATGTGSLVGVQTVPDELVTVPGALPGEVERHDAFVEPSAQMDAVPALIGQLGRGCGRVRGRRSSWRRRPRRVLRVRRGPAPSARVVGARIGVGGVEPQLEEATGCRRTLRELRRSQQWPVRPRRRRGRPPPLGGEPTLPSSPCRSAAASSRRLVGDLLELEQGPGRHRSRRVQGSAARSAGIDAGRSIEDLLEVARSLPSGRLARWLAYVRRPPGRDHAEPARRSSSG